MIRLATFFLSSFLLVSGQPAVAAESYLVRDKMYADSEFKSEQYRFNPHDKIYVVLDFVNIPAGQYNLTADWITPWGSLERQTTHAFSLERTTPAYQVYFWLKLHRKGPLKRALTGVEFKEEFFGEWKVNYYLNGLSIGQRKFEVH